MVQVPLTMDSCGHYVVAASAPLDIRMWRVDLPIVSKPSSKPTAVITTVRELSIMSVGQPLRVRLCQEIGILILVHCITMIEKSLIFSLDHLYCREAE